MKNVHVIVGDVFIKAKRGKLYCRGKILLIKISSVNQQEPKGIQ